MNSENINDKDGFPEGIFGGAQGTGPANGGPANANGGAPAQRPANGNGGAPARPANASGGMPARPANANGGVPVQRPANAPSPMPSSPSPDEAATGALVTPSDGSNTSDGNSGNENSSNAKGILGFWQRSRARERADREKKKRRRNGPLTGAVVGAVKGIIYITAVTVVGIALALFFVIPVGNDIFALKKEAEVIDITIPEMATLDDVADIFYKSGLISYPRIFKLYCNFTENKNSKFYGVYLAGDYSLSTTLNYSQLLDSLKPASDVSIVSITIPEGLTTYEIIDLFVNQNGIGTEQGFVDAINTYDWSVDYDYWFVDELMANGYSEDRIYRLDGYLYPDTYYFYSDSTEVEVIARLLDNFDKKFSDEFRAYVAASGLTVDQSVTLASMIEGEARYRSEFGLVSSVFHNRLNHADSYPYLESDATIMYAIFSKDHVRPEKLSGTEYDSPYNTYKNKGLPPGPICNPGYEALLYSIYPRSTDYFYFVANTDGYSVFSTTLSEHEQAIEDIKNGVAVSTVFQGSSGGEYDEDGDDIEGDGDGDE